MAAPRACARLRTTSHRLRVTRLFLRMRIGCACDYLASAPPRDGGHERMTTAATGGGRR
jgi:hypothetical protein